MSKSDLQRRIRQVVMTADKNGILALTKEEIEVLKKLAGKTPPISEMPEKMKKILA